MGQVPDVSSLTNDEIAALAGGQGSGPPGIPDFDDTWMTVRAGSAAAGATRGLARGINLLPAAVIFFAGDGDMGEDG